jgi:transcriptional regulator with XRE-family HTH domain
VELAMYDALNLCQPSIPPRSVLYQLTPIGIGTSGVESLTSYINRLAAAHCLTPGNLIVKIIAPQINSGFARKITSRGLNTLFDLSHALNATGEIATNFIQALEALTLRNDLHYLTLLSWSDVLLSRELVRTHKTWCPQCYQDWHISGDETYDPLLWSIAPVKICQIHQVALQDTCPHCHQNKLPLLTWKSHNAYCSRCAQLLASEKFTLEKNILNANFSKQNRWNISVVSNIGDLVGHIPCQPQPSKSQVYPRILMAVNKATEGNISSFAKLLNLPKNTVWGWCREKSFPPINSLLKIVDLLNISLIEFLLNDIDTLDSNIIKLTEAPKIPKSKRRSSQQFNYLLVQTILIETLNKSEDLVPSIREISMKLGYDPRTLLRHFPDLCQKIVAKRTHLEKKTHLRKIESYCVEVRTVTLAIRARGEYPTELMVAQMITKPGCLRYRQVRSAFQEAKNSALNT